MADVAAPNATGYETVIGLEIHAELRTASKIFCGCSTDFGAEPNTHVCPVCLGLPGSLPVLNEKALELAVKAGLALGCEIAPTSKFDRKNYFYPDLPKAYQISQYDLPLCRAGAVEIEVDGRSRRIGITRVHLEEEAGKSVHSGERIVGSESSRIDYNRSGIPLIEIVTEPDLRSPEEARLFLEEVKRILQYTGVSDCKMEEGSLRCDANISLRPQGSKAFGTKTELKNMNSFRAVERALTYEARRQQALLEAGEPVVQETRHWDEQRQVTVSMRGKEEAHDYRYFPDPDLPPIALSKERIEAWRAALPELPAARRRRMAEVYGLPAYDIGVLTASRAVADFFETVAVGVSDAKLASNWVMGEVLRLSSRSAEGDVEIPLEPQALIALLRLVKDGTIHAGAAKDVLAEVVRTGRDPLEIVTERGLNQISKEESLVAEVEAAIEAHPDAVASVRGGKEAAIGFLVGAVMRATKGRANPKVVQEMLRERIGQG